MKQYVHSITFRLIVKDNEDSDWLKQGFSKLIPLDFKKEKLSIREEIGTSLDLPPITICTLKLTKKKHVHAVIEHLFSQLSSAQIQLLLDQYESRVDGGCNFFVRLDRDHLLDNTYEVTESGNCYHIKMLIAAYPANQKNGRTVVHEMLTHYLSTK